jgi:hypothetical protein
MTDRRRICRNCEYWDAGGELAAKTALVGDCLNRNSDRFNPEWDHTCPAFVPGEIYPPGEEPD